MGQEIEYKFLVTNDTWREGARAVEIRQGYLSAAQHATVRVRLKGDLGKLTIKGATHGATRAEFEYDIPAEDATAMLDTLCTGGEIHKTRHVLVHQGHEWVVDVFHGENQGLVVAEIELSSEDEVFARPSWLGADVTQDPRYLNAVLSKHPWRTWKT